MLDLNNKINTYHHHTSQLPSDIHERVSRSVESNLWSYPLVEVFSCVESSTVYELD